SGRWGPGWGLGSWVPPIWAWRVGRSLVPATPQPPPPGRFARVTPPPMSLLSMATAGACWAATPPARPANAAAIAAAPRYSLPLLVMSLLSMGFPLSHLGDPHAGRWRDLNHDLLAHCQRKCGRCPFTLAANRAYLPLQAGKGMQAPLARFPRRPASI